MHIGICIPQSGAAAAAAVTSFAIDAERAGFDSLWAADRTLAPLAPRSQYPASADGSLPAWMTSVVDPLVALTAAASVTSTIRLGTSVLVAPWYPPVLLARSATALDRLSGGRFTLGLGLGWSIDEFAAAGAPMRARGARMEEILDVIDAVWQADVVSITTTREHVAPSRIDLKPVAGRVPVSLAAFTPDGLDRIARRADGWNMAGIPVESAAAMWLGVLAGAERAGRDPGAMTLAVRANVALTDPLAGPRPDFVGSAAQVRDDIRRCADAGVGELILDLHGCTTDPRTVLGLAAELTAHAMSGV